MHTPDFQQLAAQQTANEQRLAEMRKLLAELTADDQARPCTPEQIAAAQAEHMWDFERRSPWLAAALYGAALVLTLLLSHCAAQREGWPW